PASGVALGLMLVTRPGQRLAVALTLCAANIGASVYSGNSLLVSATFMLVNVAETGLGVLIVRRIGSEMPTLTSVGDVTGLVVAATIGNAASSAIGAIGVSRVFGLPYADAYLGWWTSDALGILLVTPLVIVVQRSVDGQPAGMRHVLRGTLFLAVWT